jgi:hypothetical protein
LRIKRSNALIVDKSSLSLLASKNFTHPVASRMSRSAVLNAAGRGSHSVTAMLAMEHHGKCILQYALNVALKPKCLLSLVKTDQSIAAIATIKSK